MKTLQLVFSQSGELRIFGPLRESLSSSIFYPMQTQESTTNNYVSAKVGEEVARLRRAAGLSQGELLEGLKPYGISWSRPLISWVENGRRSLDLEELTALAAFFRVTPTELLAKVG